MDADLERLARDAAGGDCEAVRRHETALIRAGRREEVEARYWAKFVCLSPWDGMRSLVSRPPMALQRRRCGGCRDVVELASAPGRATRIDRGELPSAFERLRAGGGAAIDASLEALGRSVEALIEDPSFDGGSRKARARLHVVYLHEAGTSRRHMPGFLEDHPEVAAALDRVGVEVVPFGVGEDASFPDLLRWWPHLLAALAPAVAPGRRPVVLLESWLGSIRGLEISSALPDLAGWLGVGEGGALFLSPDGTWRGDIAAYVLEWCRARET